MANVSAALRFVDPISNSEEIRVPAIDVVRDMLVARDGHCATEIKGSVVKLALSRGWVSFDAGDIVAAVTNAKAVYNANVPVYQGIEAGKIVHLSDADAAKFGVEHTAIIRIVNGAATTLTGCLAISLAALDVASKLTAGQPVDEDITPSTASSPLTAMPIIEALADVKLNGPAMGVKTVNGQQFEVFCFPEGKVVSGVAQLMAAHDPYAAIAGTRAVAAPAAQSAPTPMQSNNQFVSRYNTTRRR